MASRRKCLFLTCVCGVYSNVFGLLSGGWLASGNPAFFEGSGMKTA
jgi:hypothetical protein